MKKFQGFPPEPTTNYWRYPKDLNGHWHELTGSEQKVLDYILRHTWGFNKTSDKISRKQFQFGIQKKNGDWLDRGTGLSQASISRALNGLEEKGFIIRLRKGKKLINEYSLTINSDYSKRTIKRGKNEQSPSANMSNPYTIYNKTIKNNNSSSSKGKPYYKGDEMRYSRNKWWVLRGGEWLEFAGSKDDITYKKLKERSNK